MTETSIQLPGRFLDPELSELLNEPGLTQGSLLFQVDPCALRGAELSPWPERGGARFSWTPAEAHLVSHFREELAALLRAEFDRVLQCSNPTVVTHPSRMNGRDPSGEPIRETLRAMAGDSERFSACFEGGLQDPTFRTCQEFARGGLEPRPSTALRLIHAARRLADTDKLRVCHAMALMDAGEFYEGHRLARTCSGPQTDAQVRASAWSVIAKSQSDMNALAQASESYLRAANLDSAVSVHSFWALLCSLQVGDEASARYAADLLEAQGSFGDADLLAQSDLFAHQCRMGEESLSTHFHPTLSRIEPYMGPLTWHVSHEVPQAN